MKLRNDEMDARIEQLRPLLERDERDMVAYAVGRNMRRLVDASMEWTQMRRDAIEKYGTPVLDDNGNDTGIMEVKPDSENFRAFVDELAPFAGIEHEVELFTIPYEYAMNALSGQQIYDLYWLFEDEKGADDGNRVVSDTD